MQKKAKKRKPKKLRHYDLNPPDRETLVKENLANVGGQRMEHELEERNSVGPLLSAGDLDADWQRAEDSGEEAVGGSAPTPDQAVVDEIGRAVGMEFDDDEELHTHEEVFTKRDRNRWELDRRSVDDTSDTGGGL